MAGMRPRSPPRPGPPSGNPCPVPEVHCRYHCRPQEGTGRPQLVPLLDLEKTKIDYVAALHVEKIKRYQATLSQSTGGTGAGVEAELQRRQAQTQVVESTSLVICPIPIDVVKCI